MKALALTFGIGAVVALSGCSSMSGFDAKSEFACKAPDGILCESMSGIYANAQAKNLPGQRVNARGEAPVELSQAKAGSNVMTKPIYSGTPIRSAPRLLRVWFAPWEDTDGDLHDQSYVYLPVDSGRWLIEHNRRRIQDNYRPVRAPSNVTAQAAQPQTAGAGQQRQSPGVLGQQPTPPADNGMESIGVRQDRMSNEQATELLNGIMRPGNVIPDSE
ncbi:conjugal transfer pilus assembly protein TraV [Cupriavidus metallidurans]|uniref:Type IV conjugative transfer system protein TraV n=4 Tax=Betaproteobacteria TaxID=28216 RepID=F4GGU6_ALIDK|nr:MULTISPECIES: type IV conjugative transfer system lipoprotein TraV [Betaproteobacteria]NMF99064.1 type IV conjugative transfer system lipoprotein TraV [Aromatoleum toluolicum]TXH13588.1 MAG: type IV conjugative transfer system protein TraV [Gammaproteobacteria bacterium]AEB87066.1 type IV conjugative transfer system protein TraV [Alicycliphilus denitrificans K601]ART57400.1 type IV conjugative transfer system protein TraV [Acidovorax carolinensis]ART61597.1 type IV conjugative transfer syst